MGDFGEFSSKASDGLAEKSDSLDSTEEANFGNTMPALDMPSFDAPKFMPDALAEAREVTADNVLDLSESMTDTAEGLSSYDEFNLDSIEFPHQDSPVLDADLDTEAVLDISGMNTELTSADFNSSTDFNFDIQTISPEAGNYEDDGAIEANIFDLNTIDLELNYGVNEAEEAAPEAPGELNVSGNEPIEVETKLDLVVAYIEMDDKEGAKELLDEVMKEGGVAQRKRAEALLAQIA